MIKGHGGNIKELAVALGCSINEIVDMSSNLNPLGPPENLKNIICNNLDKIESLPEPDAISMKKGFAKFHGIDHDEVVAGNGTTWFIYTIPKAIGSKKVLIVGPSYSDYQDACLMHKIKFEHCLSQSSNMFNPDIDKISDMAKLADTVFICNPNNPTGSLISKDKLEYLVSKHENCVFIIDESYLPFVDRAKEISMVVQNRLKNLIVLSSMSKIFRIPGLRTGFLSACRNIVEKVICYSQPWSVNSLAQAVINDIFDHPEKIEPFYNKTRVFIKREKEVFLDSVNNIPGLQIFDSKTYFTLAKLTGNIRSKEFCAKIGKDKVLIRDCTNFTGLSDRYVRFSLKTREENLNLAKLIKQIVL
ncbi:aminotransferase class I/II-fold pyridoxal phosphate-dependent enzyme [bacterium]|nr:aminotransferase class I/II-fold pyridoxal phosphate-dependent enzyme [bacterium]